MNERGKSDGSVVPKKSPNKAEVKAAEEMEGRDPTKGNSNQQNTFRTQSRADVHRALERVRKVARRNREQRFTAPTTISTLRRGGGWKHGSTTARVWSRNFKTSPIGCDVEGTE